MTAIDEGLQILDEEECWRLMRTARVGRVAVGMGAVPAVFPVAFIVVGSDILFFTGSGIKYDAAREGRSVSFEVDEIDVVAEMGWSVLAVGPIAPASSVSKARAQALGLYAWAAGDRQQLLRIRPDFLSGRRILH
jgi:nitroimidazol reductase NimA-like FMN-containing flavoprotein (pyridoxamine 5'-phosphate oxidase superfamily)